MKKYFSILLLACFAILWTGCDKTDEPEGGSADEQSAEESTSGADSAEETVAEEPTSLAGRVQVALTKATELISANSDCAYKLEVFTATAPGSVTQATVSTLQQEAQTKGFAYRVSKDGTNECSTKVINSQVCHNKFKKLCTEAS